MRKLLAILFLSLSGAVSAEMNFDGTDDYVSISNSQTLDFTSAYTLCAWVYPSSATNYNNILTRGAGETDDIEWYLTPVSVSGPTMVIVHNRGNGGTFSYVTNVAGTTDTDGVSWGIPPNNTWTHACVTWSGSSWRGYYNGVSTGTASSGSSVAPLDTNRGWFIGTVEHSAFDSSGGRDNFWGVIDDVRIYNRVLSASEIESIALSRSRLHITDGLVGYWRLDNGTDGATASGTGTALDISGNEHHGTPTGGPTWRGSSLLRYP